MHSRLLVLLGALLGVICWLLVPAAGASAEERNPFSFIGLSPVHFDLFVHEPPPVDVWLRTPERPAEPQFTYSLFATELVAFVAKEILDDAGEEYAGSTIPSRLSSHMPQPRSRFGAHCLIVVKRIGSSLSSRRSVLGLSAGGSHSPAIARGIGQGLAGVVAVGQLWSALRNRIEDRRSGFSLDPKVSTNRFALSLTIHF